LTGNCQKGATLSAFFKPTLILFIALDFILEKTVRPRISTQFDLWWFHYAVDRALRPVRLLWRIHNV